MQQNDDPYWKLRPRGPTSPDDCCSCNEVRAVYLAHVLSDNPIQCASCRKEVAPERTKCDAETAEVVANWNTIFGSVYALWLDSGEYENWAEAELKSARSIVNTRGMNARRQLSRFVPTQYLWFWAEVRPTHCPVCTSEFRSTEGERVVCHLCEVLA